MISIEPVSEDTLIIYFADMTDNQLASVIRSSCQALHQQLGAFLVEIVPSYTSIFIQYQPLKISFQQLQKQLSEVLEHITQYTDDKSTLAGKHIELPAYYHQDVAPDLLTAARQTNFSVEEFIAIHSHATYRVRTIGFAPGFAFLGTVDARIALPRHSHPRSNVSKGSIGIAGQQTAVYPQKSPGGWQIIGNCPLTLFDPDTHPMTPFAVGDTVTFKPISRAEFIALGGHIPELAESL